MQMDLPVVEVDQGSLRGTNGVNHLGENYLRFHGIPYAKPPVRFLVSKYCNCVDTISFKTSIRGVIKIYIE